MQQLGKLNANLDLVPTTVTRVAFLYFTLGQLGEASVGPLDPDASVLSHK